MLSKVAYFSGVTNNVEYKTSSNVGVYHMSQNQKKSQKILIANRHEYEKNQNFNDQRLVIAIEVFIVLLIACSVQIAKAGYVAVPGMNGPVTIEVVSYKEARFRNVIKQQYDFSCGSAALATLLSFHYELPTTEKDVFESMYAKGDQEKIAREGFSLLDMKLYLESKGLDSDGYQLSLEKLATAARIPAIALINLNGYNHFVVVKGITDKEVLVSDPALGARVMGRNEFESSWNGLVFIIKNKLSVGRSHYNSESDWRVRNRAPFGTALSRQGLAIYSVTIQRPFEF